MTFQKRIYVNEFRAVGSRRWKSDQDTDVYAFKKDAEDALLYDLNDQDPDWSGRTVTYVRESIGQARKAQNK